MMKKNRLYVVVLLMMLISGCGISGEPSDLLQTPAQDVDEQAITQAVMQLLPVGAHLTLPLHSEDASAIQLKDLDTDGQDEIIAFYKTDKSDYEIHMLILSQKDGQWSEVTTITEVGKDLDYVQFVDVTGDDVLEILVGLSAGEEFNKELTVYTLKNGEAIELMRQSYSDLIVSDLNDDAQPEIVLLDSWTSSDLERLSKVVLYGAKDGRVEQLAERKIEGTPYQFFVSKASTTQNGIFIDMVIGMRASYSVLLVWEDEKLFDVLTTEETMYDYVSKSQDISLDHADINSDDIIGEKNYTYKDYPLDSVDINHDGIVEIGFLIAPPGTEDMTPLATPFISKYYQWDGKTKLLFVEERFEALGYDFPISDKWVGKYTVERQDDPVDPSEIRFLYMNETSKEKAPLLTLRMLPIEDWSKLEAELKAQQIDYTVLSETEEDVTIAIQPAGAFELSNEALQEYKQLLLTKAEMDKLIQRK